MKIFRQVALIAAFSIIGEIISWLLTLIITNFFIPGSLIGMILLFILLKLKIIKYEWIDSVTEFFLSNMGFFFVPAAVSILEYYKVLAPIWPKLLLIITISFFLTFTAIGLSVKFTLFLSERGKK
jgi:holin-like protein